MGKYKKYFFNYLAILICGIITFSGIVVSIGEDLGVGVCFIIVGLMCFWFSNNMVKDRFDCSMIDIIKELHLYTCVQFLFFSVPFGILLFYGTQYFDQYSLHKSLFRASENIRGVTDIGRFENQQLNRASYAFNHFLVLYGSAFLMLVVMIMQIIKNFTPKQQRSHKTEEFQKSLDDKSLDPAPVNSD